MESFNSTIIVVSVALLAWYFGQSAGRKRVRQDVKRLQHQVDRLEERVDRRSGEGGGDFGVLGFLMAVAIVVTLLISGI